MNTDSIVVNSFVSESVAAKHAKRMDHYYREGNYMKDDPQAPNSFSWYCLHYDLLEDCLEPMCRITGLDLEPTYDYSRIYKKGEVLKKHTDRPSCEISVTLNLKNVGEGWEFCWTGGSKLMNVGDAVIYKGCALEHWRDTNPSESVYQVFLHYVRSDGPYREKAYEYLRRKPSHIQSLLNKEMNP